jgi:hypothetical protein
MNMMKKSILSVLTLAAIGGAAHAGWTHQHPVEIQDTYANGQSGAARNSADDKQWIGCQLFSFGAGSLVGVCGAADEKGNVASCYFQNVPELTAVVQAIGTDSWIGFGWNDVGECTTVLSDTSSYNEPK